MGEEISGSIEVVDSVVGTSGTAVFVEISSATVEIDSGVCWGVSSEADLEASVGAKSTRESVSAAKAWGIVGEVSELSRSLHHEQRTKLTFSHGENEGNSNHIILHF